MPNIFKYQKTAEDCRRRAAVAKDDDEKKALEHLTAIWESLAKTLASASKKKEFLVASILLATSILTSFAQNDEADFIKNRSSYPLWNNSLKRDVQGFKPGMTELEAKQRLSDCEASRRKILCPGSSKDERFELSLTEHTTPRLVKDVTYIFPTGGATLETMAKNVMARFGVGKSQECLPPPQGFSQCSQWQLEDGSYMRLGVDGNQRNMFLYLSTPKWVTSLEGQAFEKEQGKIPPQKF
jgi:hypothetical protein